MKMAVVGGVMVCLLLAAGQTRAKEPVREFLDGLRERGYPDMALEYMDRMKTSPLAPADFKKTLAYEQGVTMVAASRLERDPQVREKRLDEARAKLQEFLDGNKKHALAPKAINQMGNIMVERARIQVSLAEKPNITKTQKEATLEKARKYFDDAHAVFEKRKAGLREQLLKVNKEKYDPDKDTAKITARDELRGAYVQVQLVAATILREKAETYPRGNAEKKAVLETAAKSFAEVYEKYRTRLAGLYARLYQARCLQEMGKFQEAITFYSELLEQPDKPDAFRNLRTKTLKFSMECKLDQPAPKEGAKDFTTAIAACNAWIAGARPIEDKNLDFLELRLLLAKAIAETANTAKNERDKKRQIDEAKKLAMFVASVRGPYKKPAEDFLAGVGYERPEPENFTDAKDAGYKALQTLQAATFKVKLLTPRLAKQKEAAKKAAIQAQIDEANKQITANQKDAVKFFQLALALAEGDTSFNDINIVRYFLCYLYYLQEDYYDAAVMGEFVATKAPETSGGRQCAKIAMASYAKLHKENEAEDFSFESDHIIKIADYLARKWPDKPEAEEALIQLINFKIRQNNLNEAEAYLGKISPDSPKRGDAELKTGQALWSNYLVGMKKLRDVGDKATPKQIDDYKKKLEDAKKRAQSTLVAGIERMRQGEVNATLALAMLSLAQIYVDTNQPMKAIPLLEDPEIGVKKLVDDNHEAVARQAFKEETYRVALRAYIDALPQQANAAAQDAMIAKAVGVMNALQALVGSTKEGQDRLIQIYIKMAQDVKKQIDRADADVKPGLVKGFEMFLSRVGEKSEDFRVHYWAGETFDGFGQTFDTGAGKLSPEATAYYNKAIKMYEKIIAAAGKNKEIGDAMVMQVQMRLAAVNGRLGEFEETIELYSKILEEKNMMLDVQVDAAMAYQQWGDSGKCEYYDRAIKGGPEDVRKRTIWGWGEMSRKIGGRKEYDETFFKARYNLALCRYKQGKCETGKAQAKKYFDLAEKAVIVLDAVSPELGGPEWRAKFNDLLKKTQEALGKEVVGLPPLPEED